MDTRGSDPNAPGPESRGGADAPGRRASERDVEDRAGDSEESYRTLLESMEQGFCTMEVLFDEDQRPVDCRYLEVNPAFERHTGLKAVEGCSLLELMPDIEPSRLDFYGHVALSGEHARMITYTPPLRRWFELEAFRIGRPSERRVAVLFQDVTERHEALMRLRENEERQAFLLKLNDLLQAIADPRELQRAASALLADQLHAERAYYVEMHDERGRLLVSGGYAHAGAANLTGSHPIERFGEIPVPLREGLTLAVDDTHSSPVLSVATRASCRALRIRGAIAVPRVREGRLAWVLVVFSNRRRSWTPTEIGLAEETLERTLDALERARAEEALRQSEARHAFLLHLNDRLAPIVDAEAIKQRTAAVLGEHLGANRVAYAEGVDEGTVFVGPHYVSGVREIGGTFRYDEFGPTIYEQLLTGRTRVLSDVAGAPDVSPSERAAYAAIESGALITVPLVKQGALVGVFTVHYRGPHDFAPAEIELVESVAQRTWDAIHRARAEAAHRESEERFRAVVDLVPDLLWRSDPTGYTTWYNRRWSEYTGRSDEESFGWGWTDTIHPDDREDSIAATRRAAATGEPLQLEHRIRGGDGAYRWFLVRAEPLRDEQGDVMEWFGTATDVHAQRQAMADLEGRVHERTREVRELAGTLTLAEQEERRRISQILHDDLQQLLYGIQMKLAVARHAAAKHDPGALIHLSDGALRLLEDAITRTRQLTVDLSPPVLEGEGLVAALEWLRRPMQDLHGLEVEIRGARGVDVRQREMRVLLFHSVRELLFNVAKHSGTNTAAVEIDREEGRVRISVRDEGHGFDPSTVQPPERLLGGGFGIFSVRERLRLQGGELEIESSPGAGTHAVIYAPASSSEAQGGESPDGGSGESSGEISSIKDADR